MKQKAKQKSIKEESTRMRIGHIHLNGALCIIGKHERSFFSCVELETVQHVLHCYPKYENQRCDLIEQLQELELEDFSLQKVLDLGTIRKGK